MSKSPSSIMSKIDKDYTPRNLADVASKYGAVIKEADLAEGKSGFVVRARDNSEAYIVVNRKDSPSAKRWTVAHEIGHLEYHKDGKAFYEERERGVDNEEEKFANKFAENLLLPEEDIKRLVRLDAPFELIRKRFGVSPIALSRRLEGLGLLDGDESR